MKVALVSAPNHFENRRPSPSLALAVLSSILKNANIQCQCIDCNFLSTFDAFRFKKGDPAQEKKLLDECIFQLVQYRPDVIAISAWGVSIPFEIVLSRAIRVYFPDTPIIAGGIRDRFLGSMLMKHAENINAIIIGDGESVIIKVMKRIQEKQDFKGIRGVVHRVNSKVHCEPKALPLPVSSWGKPEYSSFIHPYGKRFLVEGSRGCSYECIFCCLNEETLRRKSPEALVNEIINLKKEEHPFSISLSDNFIPTEGHWTDRFCDLLLEKRLDIKWTCCIRADRVSASTVKKMAMSGCVGVFIGVESISADTLNFINKSPSTYNYISNLMNNILTIKDSGLYIKVSTIIGFPYEGIGDIQRTVDFVQHLKESGIDAYTGPVVVYPGSRLWDMYSQGKIKLRKITNQGIRRNFAGLFSSHFEDIPYFVPNNFLVEHKFLEQDELESLIFESLCRCRD